MEGDKAYKNEVKTMLEDIRSANITLGNYRRYFDKLQNTEQIILAQIENNVSEYSEMAAKQKEVMGKQSFIDQYDGGIVSSDMFDLANNMKKKIQDTYGWKSLQMELNATLLRKIQDVMGDTQALDIKRDSLKEMRDDSERRNKMFLDSQHENNELLKSLMNSRHKILEERMELFMAATMKEVDDKVKLVIKMLTSFSEIAGLPPPRPEPDWKASVQTEMKKVEQKAPPLEEPLPPPPELVQKPGDDWRDAESKLKKVREQDEDDDEEDELANIPEVKPRTVKKLEEDW